MSEELDTAQQAAPEGETAPETPETEHAAEGEQQATETPENTAENGEQENQDEPEKPKREPWYQRRIDELTRARREAERKAQALEAIINSGRGDDDEPQARQAEDPHKLAEQMVAQQRLNDAADRTYEAGKKAHADFDNAVRNMQQLAELPQRPDFIEAVTSLPNAHEVYYHLGNNLDEAAHVLSLPPVRMAIELANISAQVGRPKAQSKAPSPTTPIGSKAVPSGDLSDDLSTVEWIKRRSEQVKGRRR